MTECFSSLAFCESAIVRSLEAMELIHRFFHISLPSQLDHEDTPDFIWFVSDKPRSVLAEQLSVMLLAPFG